MCCPGKERRKTGRKKKKPSNTHTWVTSNIPHYFLTNNYSTLLIISNIPIFLTNNDSTPFDVQMFNEIITWPGRTQKELIFKERAGLGADEVAHQVMNGVCCQA